MWHFCADREGVVESDRIWTGLVEFEIAKLTFGSSALVPGLRLTWFDSDLRGPLLEFLFTVLIGCTQCYGFSLAYSSVLCSV